MYAVILNRPGFFLLTDVQVDDNPFEDIVPRITAAEKREQQKARAEARKEAKEAKLNARRKGTK
jgi:peptidyl-prolyl cis-trans isomerase SDCCAG10